jgi:hypothetical protein
VSRSRNTMSTSMWDGRGRLENVFVTLQPSTNAMRT